eukprot:m.281804 g.281804  ORF g.281804 m.281804 type:complete len:69 (-) comp72562_c0_seq1:15-221(-)
MQSTSSTPIYGYPIMQYYYVHFNRGASLVGFAEPASTGCAATCAMHSVPASCAQQQGCAWQAGACVNA